MTDDFGNHLFAFLDETASIKHYRVGALVIRGRDNQALKDDLDAVMQSASGSYGIDAATELHAHQIFHGANAWNGLKPRQRIGIYSAAIDASVAHAETIMFRGVHRPGHKRRYNGAFSEHEAALTYIFEELDRYAETVGVPVHIAADQSRFDRRARSWLESAHLKGTWGYRSRMLTSLVQFECLDSATYRQIQAIDLISYMKTRMTSGVETDPRALRTNENIWAKIQPFVSVDRIWYPS